MRLLVAVVQVAGHKQHQVALRVADLDLRKVAAAGFAVVGEGEIHRVARHAVEAAQALADHGVKRRRARQRVQCGVVVAVHRGQRFQVEAVAAEVDLQVVGPGVDVAIQFEAVRDAHARFGVDAAAAGHAASGVSGLRDQVVRHVVVARRGAGDHVGGADAADVDVAALHRRRAEDADRGVEPGLAGVEQAVAVNVTHDVGAQHHRHRAEVVGRVVGGRVVPQHDVAQRIRAGVAHLEGEGRHRAVGQDHRAAGVVGVFLHRGLLRVHRVDGLDDGDARRAGGRGAKVVRQIGVLNAHAAAVGSQHRDGVHLLACTRRGGRAHHTGRGEEPDLASVEPAVGVAVAVDVHRHEAVAVAQVDQVQRHVRQVADEVGPDDGRADLQDRAGRQVGVFITRGRGGVHGVDGLVDADRA